MSGMVKIEQNLAPHYMLKHVYKFLQGISSLSSGSVWYGQNLAPLLYGGHVTLHPIHRPVWVSGTPDRDPRPGRARAAPDSGLLSFQLCSSSTNLLSGTPLVYF